MKKAKQKRPEPLTLSPLTPEEAIRLLAPIRPKNSKRKKPNEPKAIQR